MYRAGARLLATNPSAMRPVPEIARAGEVHCTCCKRAPLVGEKAILHVRGERRSWACELCERSARKVAPLGEVRDRVRVRPSVASMEPVPMPATRVRPAA